MRTRRFKATAQIAVPAEAAFQWVSAPEHVKEVLEGVERWRPLGRAVGEGARFDVVLHAFGLRLESVLMLDQWEPPRRIGWISESGPIAQSGSWDFVPVPGGVEVTLELCYTPPGGGFASALAGRLDALIVPRVERALEAMRLRLEERPSEA